MKTTTVYRSSNGDDWLLTADAAGKVTVIHRANPASGGKVTVQPVDEFLERGGGSPEAMAVRAALDNMASTSSADGDIDETGKDAPADHPLPDSKQRQHIQN